jgi:hypothetical protein
VNELERRWAFLEDNPAVEQPGWLPPAEECPELADLREQHEHVLATFADARRAVGDLHRRAEAEAAAQTDALKDAILAGKGADTVELPEVTVAEGDVAEAIRRAQVARDALQQFARQAVETMRERATTIHAGLDERLREADAKREQARKLLAEADRVGAEPKRMRNWIDRATGDSALGLYAYADMPAPLATPVPEVFQEIAGLPPTTVVAVGHNETGDVEVMSHA